MTPAATATPRAEIPGAALDPGPDELAETAGADRSAAGSPVLLRRSALAALAVSSVALATGCRPLPEWPPKPGPKPTPRPTPRPTPSASPSVSPSATASPSMTASPSPSMTPSPSPSMSPSMTASPSPSMSPSMTASPSPSMTASPSTSPTANPSPSASPSASPSPSPSGSTSAPPSTPAELTAFHLLSRATYGVTGPALDEATQLGLSAWLDRQLKPESIADPVGDAIDAAWPRTAQPVEQLFDASNAYEVRMELVGRHLVRAAWGSRQLFEVMVDFWSNHLNVNVDADQDVIWARPAYDVLIRRHTFGRFDAMLRETGMTSAMLLYLSNAGSEKRSPNENYAREVMELHTLGVDGGYTEADVKNVALLLTGWTAWYNDTDKLRARYDANRHHVGPLKILGRTFANPSKDSGPAMWTELADFLAHHESTATYLATKLVRRFVSDEPDPDLVAALARVYLANDTAIVPVLRELFGSPQFAAAAGRKVKRPMERYVATVRLLASKPPADLRKAGLEMARRVPGQVPLSWAAPNGYPDAATAWQSPGNALDLFNRGANMLQGRTPDLGIDGTARILGAKPTTPEAVAAAAAQVVLLGPPTTTEANAAVALLRAAKLTGPYADGSAAQRRAAEIAGALFLTTPAHLTR